MEKRERRGKKPSFRTPACDIQDRFDDAGRILMSKKANWGKLAILARVQYKKCSEDIGKNFKSFDALTTLSKENSLNHWLMLLCIATLGYDITDIHKRLAKCEQSIEALRLRTK